MGFVDDQATAWSDIRKLFQHNETANGPGSTQQATVVAKSLVPQLIRDYNITTMLDAPCGDWNWMQHVNLDGVHYTGFDLEFAGRNAQRWPQHTFKSVNILRTRTIPTVDLILCRDFLIHLPNTHAHKVIRKFIDSGSRYLLTTNHPRADNTDRIENTEGHDDRPGYFHWPVNLDIAPYALERAAILRTPESESQELTLYDLHAL